MNLRPAPNRLAAAILGVAVCVSALLTFMPFAAAHKTSYGYLRAAFAGDEVSGRLELAIRDFDFAFFDYAFGPASGSHSVDWAGLRRNEPEIAKLLLGKIVLGAPDAPCRLEPGPIEVDMPGEPFLILPFTGTCPELGAELEVGYDLMFEIDPQHRAILDIHRAGDVFSGIMSPESRRLRFAAGSKHLLDTAGSYILQGAHHIWIGYDHILFLLSLLLPAVLIRQNSTWLPVKDLSGAFWSTAKIVTAFTLAHSVTLTLAALGIVELPSRFVESVIAGSIAIAAINNIYPVITRRLWVVAFVFGLIHGFGFASVLSEFGLPPGQKLVALVSFNIGVELGQITIVAAVLPILFLLRRRLGYARLVMPAGSVVITVVAVIWLVERAADMNILSG